MNREEIPVQALYRDPVHDFGFFKFDPRALQFMEARWLLCRGRWFLRRGIAAPHLRAMRVSARCVGADALGLC